MRMRHLLLHLIIAFSFVWAAAPGGPAFAQERRLPQSEAEIRLSFAPVVKKAAPAVVNVYAAQVVRERGPSTSLFNDPLFRQFFGDTPFGPPRERLRNSLGSGVIIDSEGIVVTNHHVIRGAEAVTVVLSDKREYEAAVILSDEQTDLAVLRIPSQDAPYPHLTFADSDNIEVGDLVLAIGNPFGVGQTVTSGIVSAEARTKVGVSDYQFFIQTDAPINPGNSGGALIDMTGQLIGINTAIFSRSGGSHGIGFAIPANMVRVVAESARTGNVVQRPWLGARLQPLDAEIAESLGLDRPVGVLVAEVSRDGPAARAGLRPGDVITEVGEQAVEDPDSFSYRFALQGTDGETHLRVVRDGRPYLAEIRLVPAPEDPPRDERFLTGRSPLAGATVLNLSPAVAEELQVTAPSDGVVVKNISRRSPAARMGMRPRDVILTVNDERVTSTRQLEDITEFPARTWRLEIQRGSRVLDMVVRG